MKDYSNGLKEACNAIGHNCRLCAKNYPELYRLCLLDELGLFDTEDDDKEENEK